MSDSCEKIGEIGAWALPADRNVTRLTVRLADGYHASMLRWPAAGEKLPVLMAHGIQSHPGWFVGSAAAMQRAGHGVYQVTRRGSGDSTSDRGHAKSAGQLLDDVAVAHRFVLADSGADRCHLVGVSWGGKLLAAYAAEHENTAAIASLTLLSPGIAPRVDVPFWTKVGIAACVMLRPRRLFDIPLSDVSLFTDNEAARQYLREDQHRLHRATARLLYASRCLDLMLQCAHAGTIDAPTTLLLAEGDRIIDNTAAGAEVTRLTGGRAQIEQLPGCHTQDFEPDPSAFHQAICQAIARAE